MTEKKSLNIAKKDDSRKIEIFDTTLRDGNQAQGIDLSYADKCALAKELDKIGIDYIEGGWPGANQVDSKLFNDPPKLTKSKWVAFGMTRRPEVSADNDLGLATLRQAKVATVCIVGKASSYQVKSALRIDLNENLKMISSSISFLKNKGGKNMFFDAEHFFDGFKENSSYALSCLKSAAEAGASRLVLCDTNGGTLPDEISRIVAEVKDKIPEALLGIHTHNDCGCAVANALAAVQAGVMQVQGTIGGIGERTGNANTLTVASNIQFKSPFSTNIPIKNFKLFTKLAHTLEERTAINHNRYAPYVGSSAFAHKGGLHGSAVSRDPSTYEHIDPAVVGNERLMVMSDQGGRSQLMTRLEGLNLPKSALTSSKLGGLVGLIKQKADEGYSFDGANASLELLALDFFGLWDPPFQVSRFRVIDERRINAKGKVTTESEATLIIKVAGKELHQVAFGHGPVNALDIALRKALLNAFPSLKNTKLIDFKVRIIPPPSEGTGTDAVTRVVIEFQAGKHYWTTVGVSGNIIEASLMALCEGYMYRLISLKGFHKHD